MCSIVCELVVIDYRLLDNTTQEKGNRSKRTINPALTRDLRSIVEFQPREPQNWPHFFVSHRPLCARHGYVANCDSLGPKPSRLALVQLVDGSGTSQQAEVDGVTASTSSVCVSGT